MFIDNAKLIKIQYHSLKEVEHLNIYPDAEEYIETHETFIDPKTGICFNKNFIPYEQTLLEYIWWTESSTKKQWLRKYDEKESVYIRISQRITNAKNFCLELKSRQVINLKKNTIYVNLTHTLGYYQFGHLFDTLHKLETFTSFNSAKKVCFIVSDTKNIVDFKEYLKILAPSIKFDLLEIKLDSKDVLYKCQNLIIIKPTARPTRFKSQASHDYVYNCFSSYYDGYIPKDIKSNKLFITRLPPTRRVITNFDSVAEFFPENNIHTIYGNESLADTFYYFNNATHICGYHGAGFANIIFCKKNTTVLEYCANNRLDYGHSTKPRYFNNYLVKLIDACNNFNVNLNLEEILEFYNFEYKNITFFGTNTLKRSGVINFLKTHDSIEQYNMFCLNGIKHFITDTYDLIIDEIIKYKSHYCVIDWFKTVHNTPSSVILKKLIYIKEKFDKNLCKLVFLLLPESKEHRNSRQRVVNCLIDFCNKNCIKTIDCNDLFDEKDITQYSLTLSQAKIVAQKIHDIVMH